MKLLILCFLLGLARRANGTTCSNAFECTNTTITGSTLSCDGSHSCINSNLGATANYITCRGLSACKASTIITNDDIISCLGFYSCGKMDARSNSTARTLECRADHSCADGNINITTDIWCYGDHSCANSFIASQGSQYLKGRFAARNAIFQSQSSFVTFQFLGPSSGYNATIECGDGHTCQVYCFGNSCNELNLICIGGCTFTLFCDDSAEKSIHCPNGIELSPTLYQLPPTLSTPSKTITNANNIANFCNNITNTSVLCDNYNECWDKNIDTTTMVSPVCCSGYAGCASAQKIHTSIDLTVANNNCGYNRTALRCDAANGCEEVVHSIIATNGGDIYFTGYDSAGNTNATQTTLSFDIFCTAQWGCRGQRITFANNLYCTAYQACADATTTMEFINNIYIYAEYGAYQSNLIKNIYQNVYCQGPSACKEIQFESIAGDVYGAGYETLKDCTFINIQGSIIAFGANVLTGSNIINATSLKCDGPVTCNDCTVQGLTYLFANGTQALSGSIIMSSASSSIADGHVLNVEIDDYYTSGSNFTIYCNETDTCRIDCISETACTKLHLYCFGMCFVKCNEGEGITCPTMYGNYSSNIRLPTLSPTSVPTMSPVAFPTIAPSLAPTSAPTGNPTISPTINPTTSPTIAPSAVPTDAPTNGPTRHPTNYKNYTIEIYLEFEIEWTNLSVTETGEMFESFLFDFESLWYVGVKNLLESSYVDESSGFLDFYEFDIIFTKIKGDGLGYDTELIINGANYSSAAVISARKNLKSEKIQKRKLLAESDGMITLTSLIYCLNGIDGVLRDVSESDSFSLKATSKLSNLLSLSSNVIEINPDMSSWSKTDLASSSAGDRGLSGIADIDGIYFVLGGLCVILMVITFLANLHTKGKLLLIDMGCKLADGVQIIKLWIFGLQIWDFVSDINFAAQMIALSVGSGGDNLVIFALAVLSPLFVVLPYIANIRAAMTVYDKIANMNKIAKLYFDSKFVFFCSLVLISGGVHATIQLIASKLFGMTLFDCGLSKHELILFKKVHLTHSVLFENAPQLILQIIYMIEIGTIFDDTVLFASIASFFSAMTAIFSYYFSKHIEVNQITIKLNIKFNKLNIKHDMNNCIKYMGYRNKLALKISRALGVIKRKIEVFSIINHSKGCMIYIGYALDDVGMNSNNHNNNINNNISTSTTNFVNSTSSGNSSMKKFSFHEQAASSSLNLQLTHMSSESLDTYTTYSTSPRTGHARATMSVETERSVISKFIKACKDELLIPEAIKQTWKLENVPTVIVIDDINTSDGGNVNVGIAKNNSLLQVPGVVNIADINNNESNQVALTTMDNNATQNIISTTNTMIEHDDDIDDEDDLYHDVDLDDDAKDDQEDAKYWQEMAQEFQKRVQTLEKENIILEQKYQQLEASIYRPLLEIVNVDDDGDHDQQETETTL